MGRTPSSKQTPATAGKEPRRVAVIEVGSTSIRMAVAEIGAGGRVRMLDSLQQTVSLGKDAFTAGAIAPETTEDCVRALRSFKKALREYGIIDDRHIRAVATSAVRESSNQGSFLDRLFIATDVHVEVIDQAEVNRLTYLAVRPLLKRQPFFRKSDTVVVEVGGGSTETMSFHRGKISNSHMYRLGSLRLREMLEEYRASESRLVEIMRSQVDQSVNQIAAHIPVGSRPHMLVLGGEARFACGELVAEEDRKSPARLDVDALEELTDDILNLSVDDVVRRYRLTYQEAETAGPALLVCVRLARALEIDSILVGDANLRDGLLAEMASSGSWTAELNRQIISSAVDIGKRYAIDLRHARTVTRNAMLLFKALSGEHRLDDREEIILTVASLLHETGQYISDSSHHKHSMYIILNSEIFGLGARDLLITALVARYHRRALPKPTHELYVALSRKERIVVSKLAAILRVANALDRSHASRSLDLDVSIEGGRLVITAVHAGDVTLERLRIRERSVLFRQVYGMDIVLRTDEGRATRA